MSLTRPQPNEYPSAYAPYLEASPEGEGTALLQAQMGEVAALFAGLSEEQGAYRYAPGKWSLKDLLLHLADAERIFAYRCLRIGRGDVTPLAGFDENAYADAAKADLCPMADLLTDWRAARAATLSLCRTLSDEAWDRQGITNGRNVTARCLPYMCLGHTAHHLAVIRERYLPGLK
jgi:hypothetical protein